MRASWVLIKAQFKNKKGSYISLFILTLIIGLMLSFSLSLVMNIRSAAQEAVRASNFGDLYLNFNPEYVPTKHDFDKLNKMAEFDRVAPLKKIRVRGEPASLLHSNGEQTAVSLEPAIYAYDEDQLPLRLLSDDKTAYLSPAQLAPPEKGEVYLPISFLAVYNAKLGDRYRIASQKGTFDYKVSGFVEDISQINMVSIGEHNIYLNRSDFTELEMNCVGKERETEEISDSGNDIRPRVQEYSTTYTLHLGIADAYIDSNTDDLFQRIEEETGLRSQSTFYGDDELFVYLASLVSYLVLFVIVVFVIVMFIAALAILNFNIYSSIESEYRNIGVMKAAGLKNSSFNAVYLLSYLAVLIAGLAVGSLLAIPLLRLTAPILLDITSILGRTNLALAPISGTYLILIMICLLLIVRQLHKIKIIKPYRTLSEGKQSVYASSGLKIKLAKPLFHLRLSLKQLTASAGTYFGSIFVTAILFFFLLIGFSMTTIMTPDQMMEEYWGFDWDILVLYQDQNEYEELHNEVDKIVFAETKVKDSYLVYQHMVNGLDQKIATFSLDEKYIDRITSLIAGDIPQNDNELAITKILADSKDIKIGDEIELCFEDKRATYTVTGFFQTINNIGRSVTFTTSALERLLGEAYADDLTQVAYVIEDQTVSDLVREKINLEYPDLNAISVVETWESYGLMSDAFNILPAIIFGFAIVFVIISSFLLAEKIFNREQIDFGIMKAIGFRNSITRQIFSLRFIAVAVIGLLLGRMIFQFAANPLLNKLVSLMGLSRIKIRVPLLQVIISALVMVAIFWLITYFISRKIKRLEVKDLIVNV